MSLSNQPIDHSPKITVSLSAYNAGKFIEETIQSVLHQTFTDFEFIVVNDGSTDNSLSILNKYANLDSRIVVINRENKGIIASKNEILSRAKGKYIANIDADDIALPTRFQVQLDYLEAHPEVVCVGSDTMLIDHKGRFLSIIEHLRGDKITESILEGHGAITNPAALIRTDAFRAIGGCGSKYLYAEDLDVWLKLSEVGKLENLPIILTKYRLHQNSVSEKFGKTQRESAYLACKDAWARRGIEGNFTAGNLWRPDDSSSSQLSFTLKYGWLAWTHQQYKTTIIYGLKAIKLDFFSKQAWQLLFCGLTRKR